MDEDNDAIDVLFATWRDAFRRSDVDAIIALLTPGYLLFTPGQPPLTIEALRPRLAAAMAAFEVNFEFESEDRIVSGDLAIERGWDVQTVRPRDGGEARLQRQRVFLLIRRGPDHVWRFALGVSLPGT